MAITGIGITEEDMSDVKESTKSILAAINKSNKAIVEQEEYIRQKEKEAEENRQKEEEDEERARKNQARFAKEQEDKSARLQQEAEEDAELEKKRKRNPFYKTIKKMEKGEDVETETYAAFIARTILEKGGDAIRATKEAVAKKKRDAAKIAAVKLSRAGGFEAPTFEDYDPVAEHEKKQEEKRIKKEQAEEKKRLASEKKKELAEQKRKEKEEKQKEIERKKEEERERKILEEEEKRKAEERKKEEQKRAEEERLRKEEEEQARKHAASKSAQNIGNQLFVDTENLSPEEYDKYLAEDVRDLKRLVVKEHIVPDFLVTENAVNTIQRMRDVVAVVIASHDMNHLFIFQEAATFIELAGKLNKSMNYSYIYVITTTAPLYFGSDTCYHDLTELFDEIRKVILRYGHVNRNALLKIDGINMFKKIHLDL